MVLKFDDMEAQIINPNIAKILERQEKEAKERLAKFIRQLEKERGVRL